MIMQKHKNSLESKRTGKIKGDISIFNYKKFKFLYYKNKTINSIKKQMIKWGKKDFLNTRQTKEQYLASNRKRKTILIRK